MRISTHLWGAYNSTYNRPSKACGFSAGLLGLPPSPGKELPQFIAALHPRPKYDTMWGKRRKKGRYACS